MQQIKVIKGTPASKSICSKCIYLRYRRTDAGQDIRICSEGQQPTLITKVIVECNDYQEAGKPNLYDMRQMAWFLRTNASGQAVGFMARKDFVDKFGENEADKI